MIKHGTITVEWQHDGDFLVRWATTVPGYPVSVSLGRTPDEIDPDKPAAATRKTWVRVPGLNGSVRPYFILKGENGDTHIAAQRNLPFAGTFNFRDMGGYPAQDGRRVKWGALYRSGHLSEMTEQDLTVFSDLDIGLICDFRRKDEQDLAPNRLPPGSSIHVANIPIHTGSQQSFIEKIETGKTDRKNMMGVMKQIYTNYVEAHAAAFAVMFDHILAKPAGAVLIHCTAGKDRTGFGTALILWALGVDRETIMQDYLLSRQYFPIDMALERAAQNYDRLGGASFDPKVMIPVFEVQPEYLNTAFSEIEKRFGGMDAYLGKEIGITPEIIATLRKRYLY